MKEEEIDLKSVFEGLIFVAGQEGIKLEQIASLLHISQQETEVILSRLQDDYEPERRGMQILQTGGIVQMTSRPEHAPFLQQFVEREKQTTLSQASLETLAILAFEQPVTRMEIEEIRGVKSERPIQTLMQRGLVQEVGRASSVGKPILYGTTRLFLEEFGLKSLDDLPPLRREYQEDPPLF